MYVLTSCNVTIEYVIKALTYDSTNKRPVFQSIFDILGNLLSFPKLDKKINTSVFNVKMELEAT